MYCTTILTINNQPTAVKKNTDTKIKYKFIATFIDSEYAGSIIITASIVIPANNGSRDVKIKFALKPPDTPANAAARPANGCLPNPAKITAPSGGNTT